MGSLNRAGGDPEFILARHEELAAFMATAHARFTDDKLEEFIAAPRS